MDIYRFLLVNLFFPRVEIPMLCVLRGQCLRLCSWKPNWVVSDVNWLSDFTFTFYFNALEKEMATHSSVLAWRIWGTGEPGGLPSMGSHRVGYNWSNLAAAAAAINKMNVQFNLPLTPPHKYNWSLHTRDRRGECDGEFAKIDDGGLNQPGVYKFYKFWPPEDIAEALPMTVMELTSFASQQVYRQRADSLILTSKDLCPLEQCFSGWDPWT